MKEFLIAFGSNIEKVGAIKIDLLVKYQNSLNFIDSFIKMNEQGIEDLLI